MQYAAKSVIVLCLVFSTGKIINAAESEVFFKSLAKTLDTSNERTIKGNNGWLFFRGELRHLSVGKFWGTEAANVSKASRKKFADPLPAILEFKKQLDSVGVELLLVPVPAKVIINADKMDPRIKKGADGNIPRLDKQHQIFYKLLGDQGVQVLDIYPLLTDKKKLEGQNGYCKTDTHWSPATCGAVAKQIAARYLNSDKKWVKNLKKITVKVKKGKISIKGDLLKKESDRKEELNVNRVYRDTGKPNEFLAPESDRKSPILLIGDSHTLVFSIGGDMFTRGAGLADHLAFQFQTKIDVVGVRGSGVTVPRIDLARRKDNLAGKKLVIWCFSARQFTESKNGWLTNIPLIRKKK